MAHKYRVLAVTSILGLAVIAGVGFYFLGWQGIVFAAILGVYPITIAIAFRVVDKRFDKLIAEIKNTTK
jgi:hypothetical protein